METIPVTVPNYPYDEFTIYLDPEERGALWRGSVKIAEVARTWEGWEIGGTTIRGGLTDEAITSAIDKAIEDGKLTLTRIN